MDARFDTYLKDLAAAYRDGGTEHSGRTPLQNLLAAFASETLDPGTEVQHEGGREGDKGAPDYKVRRRGMILGYVETKTIGENLDKVLKSNQIDRYRQLSDNILVTDYLQFIRIDSAGKVIAREQLAYPTDLEGRAIRVNAERAEAVHALLESFFASPPVGLSRSDKLAVALATRSRLLRDYLTEELIRQEKADREGRLHALYDVFRDQVFHQLAIKEFADAFAQMLAYGLFLAKLNAGDDDVIRLDNVRRFIPGSFRLIRELVRFLEEMQEAEYDDAKWVIEEILSIINGLAIDEIRDSLSFRQRRAISRKVRAGDEEEHRLFERDPFIYFYEDFLKAYDKETRKSRGVYYTPPPVVNFIVRAVDDILKETFRIDDGLADNQRVIVLDFAAGTGTFLLEVMQRIFDNIGGPEAGKADAVVREHMLRNLYGFEYLIAPYTIAHLKLSQFLRDKSHPLADDERLQVFLTNTLEPVEPQANAFVPALSAEVKEAQKVKDKDILVILGNPPYSGHSKNKGKWISDAIGGYKHTVERVQTEIDTEGKPVYSDVEKTLSEKNPKWLNDDYVKFIRFAQLKMDAVVEGVVGIITNHSWLDNPTFRGMRQSLMRSFDQIYLIDLHGSTKPKEQFPEGVENENVFDIQKGVAIAVFVKKPGVERGVWHTDFWGNRLEKYQECAAAQIDAVEWDEPRVFTPYYMMSPIDWAGWDEYGEWWQIADSLHSEKERQQIFRNYGVGIATGNDRVAVQFDQRSVRQALELINLGDEDKFKATFGLKKLSSDWSWKNIRADISEGGGEIRSILYRPFDHRFTYYSGRSNGFHSRPRPEIAASFIPEGLGLITSRLTKGENYAHAMITDMMAEVICLSPESSNNGFIFAIHIRDDSGRRHENLSADFRAFLDSRYDHHYSPEEILGYIYAVLHAPTYRRRYTEFLRIDFPRIPFPENADQFTAMSRLGWALVQAHLLRDLPRTQLADYHGKGDNSVEHVRWSAEDERISINRTQSFAPVPEPVWNFHIGGYQVIDKYLKSRKGRTLSLDEINHVGRIADALAFTIDQMNRIEEAYQQAFPDGG